MSKDSIVDLMAVNCEILGHEYTFEALEHQYDNFMSHPNAKIFYIDDGERIVGYLAAILNPHFITSDLYALEMGFYCNARGRGKELIKQFEDWARDRGARRAVLTSYIEYDVSNYYKRLGYRLTEQTFVKDLR